MEACELVEVIIKEEDEENEQNTLVGSPGAHLTIETMFEKIKQIPSTTPSFGDKRHVCPECGYKTSYKCYLRRHMKRHSGEKPYVCPECDFRTSRTSNLQIHMRIHSGEKPYGCPECGYRTSRAINLKTHIRKHSGEKPYSCSECGYRATQAGSIKKHMMRTHKKITEEENEQEVDLPLGEIKRMEDPCNQHRKHQRKPALELLYHPPLPLTFHPIKRRNVIVANL